MLTAIFPNTAVYVAADGCVDVMQPSIVEELAELRGDVTEHLGKPRNHIGHGREPAPQLVVPALRTSTTTTKLLTQLEQIITPPTGLERSLDRGANTMAKC
jgi:hypothetical protein